MHVSKGTFPEGVPAESCMRQADFQCPKIHAYCGIIGCGHMGSAIATALISKISGKVCVSSPTKPNLKVEWTVDNLSIVKKSDVIFLAVRPGVVESVLAEIKNSLNSNQIIISIAAGVPLSKLTKWAGGHKKIVRVMPNLPAQIFAGMSTWKASAGLGKAEKELVKNLLETFGEQIEVSNEKLIDIATAIAGGGPAYVAAFLESMYSTAKKIGFSDADARKLAIQSAKGGVAYLEKTNAEFSELKKAVQTKGGTTEAGFKVLKKGNWQKTLEKAFLAGYKRAQQLSKN